MERKFITLVFIYLLCSLLIRSHSVNAQSIAGGANHTLFLCDNNFAMSTGSSMYGQLGSGQFLDVTYPVPVNLLSGITSVNAGQYHSLFLINNGTAWTCGVNGYGQLGNGTNGNSSSPVQVNSLSGITALSGGMFHSLFLKNTRQYNQKMWERLWLI